jgi:hypothetical protein
VKDWFPFTNYDFYAYLTAGMIVIAAFDYVFTGATLAQQDWTLVNGFFWAALAYLLGQILAIPSSALFEHVIARGVFHPPTSILLGLRSPRKREKLIAVVFGAREFSPLPEPNRTRVVDKLAGILDIDVAAVSGEAAFHCAFPRARSIGDTASRLDTFLNQYGMSRNVSFASGLAAAMMCAAVSAHPTSVNWALFGGAVVLSIGLFIRFLKFYAAYSREVFRTFDMVATK